MRVYRSFQRLKSLRSSVVAIGIFDGVHSAHRKVIVEAVKGAKRLKAKSVVITFTPHPMKVLRPAMSPRTLISVPHRIRLIGELGVDIVVVLKFTKTIASLEPHQFVERILVKRLRARRVVVGWDFRFGRQRRGHIKLLKFLGAIFGFEVVPIRAVKAGGRVVSSSLIRTLITRGNLRSAARLLGRPVSILGTVVHGSRIGEVIGYPTANINPHHEAIPPSGVYAVKVRHGRRLYGGVLNIGFRPTMRGGSRRSARDSAHFVRLARGPSLRSGLRSLRSPRKGPPAPLGTPLTSFASQGAREPVVEVHLFNFKERIYGEDLEVMFAKRLRPEKRFHSKEMLAEQIRRDVARARGILKSGRARK